MVRILVLLLAVALPVAAQVRTFVSTDGVDNATCSRQAPCRTFTAAVAVVLSGGEVLALDSGGYGPVTVSKSVTILAPDGVYAAIAPTSGSAITVNPGTSSTVILRNLNITALGPASGIVATSFLRLYVDGCSISNSAGGILVDATAANQQLYVSNTTVRNSLSDGIRAAAEAGAKVRAFISGTRSNGGGGFGFLASRNADLICVECEAHSNTATGFLSDPGPVDNATLSCDRCVSSLNSNGFRAAGNASTPGSAELTLARSAALYNSTFGIGEGSNGRVLVLAGTNLLQGNGTNTSGIFEGTAPDNP